eukprot:21446-Rhodomonas_salina.1
MSDLQLLGGNQLATSLKGNSVEKRLLHAARESVFFKQHTKLHTNSPFSLLQPHVMQIARRQRDWGTRYAGRGRVVTLKSRREITSRNSVPIRTGSRAQGTTIVAPRTLNYTLCSRQPQTVPDARPSVVGPYPTQPPTQPQWRCTRHRVVAFPIGTWGTFPREEPKCSRSKRTPPL